MSRHLKSREKSLTNARPHVKFIVLSTLFLLAFLASNWIYSVQVLLPQDIKARNAIDGYQDKPKVDYLLSDTIADSRVGGWPFQFYVRVEHAGVPPFVVWSLYRLTLNILVWTLVACIPVGQRMWTQRKAARETESERSESERSESERSVSERPVSERPRRGQVGLWDLMILMLFVALVFGYWRLMAKRLSEEGILAVTIDKLGGVVLREPVVPDPIRAFLPEIYLPFFNRIVSVTLESPTDELLSRVLALPELRRLRLGGGSYDLNRLDSLRKLPYLIDLRVAGRELDGEAVAAIASCKQLISLNLLRTNISTKGFQCMNDMPRLVKLNLVHTSVDFSKVDRPLWFGSLRELALPHPGNASPTVPALGEQVCSKIVLQDWPALQNLICEEFDEPMNRNCVAMEIANCPQLKKIELDAFQRFDLALNDLPELGSVTALHSQWKARLPRTEKLGIEPWVRRMVVKGTPKLKKLSLFAIDLDELKMDPMSPTSLSVISEYRTTQNLDGQGQIQPDDKNYLDDNPLEKRQRWIDELGKNNGPSNVDLSRFDMKGLDLRPLTKNEGIRDLDLSWTQVAARQLVQLEGSKSLETLILKGSDIDGSGIRRVLAKLPTLRGLRIQSENVVELNLESIEKLETIFLESEPLAWNRLHLVSLPSLKDSFETILPLRACHLVDIPSVQGLSFQSDLPKGATIRGIRDLRLFAAGGLGVTDEIVNEVLHCKQLRSLTLAYATQVSSETLARIAELQDLEHLALPGCNVNDDVMRALSQCKKLTELILDDTSVSDTSFEGFELSALQQFSVNHTSVSEQLIRKVLFSPALSKVGLAGMKLTVESIDKLAKCRLLTEIDFSNTDLDPACWSAVKAMDSTKLSKLLFRNALIDLKSIQFLFDGNAELMLDLSGSEDADFDDGQSSFVGVLLKANRHSDIDRIVDTWYPSESPSRMSPPPIPSRNQFRTFCFSPKWKLR